MAQTEGYTHLKDGGATFSEMMLKNGFGVVTVMNAKVYDYATVTETNDFTGMTAKDIVEALDALDEICKLDTLKVANVTSEGPTKTITGGQFSNPLIKYGKTSRLEIQDALGNSNAMEALCGGLNEWSDAVDGSVLSAFHYGEDFASAKIILGDSFFIDRTTGQQVKVRIVFYQFMPDSLFNLTQDAEGDATVFDMNGDLLVTKIKTFNKDGDPVEHGLFYSIVEDIR